MNDNGPTGKKERWKRGNSRKTRAWQKTQVSLGRMELVVGREECLGTGRIVTQGGLAAVRAVTFGAKEA